MFTTKCFIRKNTPEIREKLKELGYRICACASFASNIWLYTYIDKEYNCYTVHGFGDGTIEGSQEAALNLFLHENATSENPAIDCGDDEELFLALAVLRDDSDYMQWFVYPKTRTKRLNGYFGQIVGMDGHYQEIVGYEWHRNENKDNILTQRINEMKQIEGEHTEFLPHKASVEELIEHFK